MSSSKIQSRSRLTTLGGRVARQLLLWINDPSQHASQAIAASKPNKAKRRPKPKPIAPGTERLDAGASAKALAPSTPTALTMKERYTRVTRLMLETHGVRVRKWRTSMSGVAWEVTYQDGSIARLIESPRPTGPMSAAVFLHEIGHHAIGFGTYKPRCLEEYHAWRWSLEQMQAHGLNVTDAVRRRMHESLWYALEKAKRRGLRNVPPELVPFENRPRPRAHRRR